MPPAIAGKVIDPEKQLQSFIDKFEPPHHATIRSARKKLRKLFPPRPNSPTTTTTSLSSALVRTIVHRTPLSPLPRPLRGEDYALSAARACPTRRRSCAGQANSRASFAF